MSLITVLASHKSRVMELRRIAVVLETKFSVIFSTVPNQSLIRFGLSPPIRISMKLKQYTVTKLRIVAAMLSSDKLIAYNDLSDLFMEFITINHLR